MKSNQRWLILGGLLFATLVAGYLVEDDAAPEDGKRKRATVTSAKSARAGESHRVSPNGKVIDSAGVLLSFPEPAAMNVAGEGDAINPFRNKSWFIAPPSPPPPKASAPPLPFQYLGKLSEDGEIRVFLKHQDKNLIVKVGDVINGTYSVEGIAGGQITFLYQPLKETQALAIGGDN